MSQIAEKMRQEADWLDQSGLPEPTEVRVASTHPAYTWADLDRDAAHAIMAKLGYEWRELTPTKLYGYESSPDGLVRWVYLGIKQAPAPRPLESARDVLDSFTALAVTA